MRKCKLQWILMLLGAALLNSCENESAENAKPTSPDIAANAQLVFVVDKDLDYSKRPHEPTNGLMLTAEVLDDENWIIGLTWENVSDAPLSLPFVSSLYETIEHGHAAPFLFEAYSRSGSQNNSPEAIILDSGRHADSRVFDLTLGGEAQRYATYDMLRGIWGLSGSMLGTFTDYIYHRTLGPGEKRTCFFDFRVSGLTINPGDGKMERKYPWISDFSLVRKRRATIGSQLPAGKMLRREPDQGGLDGTVKFSATWSIWIGVPAESVSDGHPHPVGHFRQNQTIICC